MSSHPSVRLKWTHPLDHFTASTGQIRIFRIFRKTFDDLMTRVASSLIIRQFGQYQDRAQREPVMVVKHNRDRTVQVSADEYRQLRRRARIVRRTEDLNEAEIAAVDRSDVPPAYEHLDEQPI